MKRFSLRLNNRARGFTVLELLTVIGIILFMVAVIIGVFVNYQKTLRIKATQKLIERIGVGLARYYGEFRTYPPDTGFGVWSTTSPDSMTVPKPPPAANEVIFDPGSIWRYLGQELTVRDSGGLIVRTVPAIVSFSQSELVAYTDTSFGPSFYVVDSWNTPLGYRGDARRVIYNRGDVDIFSAGPDKKTANNNGCGYPDSAGNVAYNGADDDGDTIVDNASEMHIGAWDGALTGAKKTKATSGTEELDDINNWDPQKQ